MKTLTISILILASFAPLAAANVDVDVRDVGDIIALPACPNPGYQGTIATVPYLVWIDGTGWQGSHYYVYGTYYYQNVDRYNYCLGGTQVGAVSTSYGGSYSWSWCVTCLRDLIATDNAAGGELLP